MREAGNMAYARYQRDSNGIITLKNLGRLREKNILKTNSFKSLCAADKKTVTVSVTWMQWGNAGGPPSPGLPD